MTDREQYMRRALALARLGEGRVSPNPMVGCVVVKDGHVISEGYHEQYGGFHAERNALLRAEEDCEGADLYVTLEPCCHYGKTPPCTEIILEKKIRRVFVGCLDPNPKVAGGGIRILREHGVEVVTGILEEECLRLNEVFFHYIRTGRPYVVMKYAMSLDGKIACHTGDSKWITGEAARNHVHLLRKRYSAILAGIGTVLADDPMLNCRTEEGVDPVRVICDSCLRIPLDSRILQTARQIPTIIAVAGNTLKIPGAAVLVMKVQETGAEVVSCGEDRVDLRRLMEILGKRKIDSVLVEGGGSIHGSVRDEGLAQKAVVYVGNVLIGGLGAPSPVKGTGAGCMKDASQLEHLSVEQLGEDLCITGYFPQTKNVKGE